MNAQYLKQRSGRWQRFHAILDIASLALAAFLVGMVGLNIVYGLGERNGFWLEQPVMVGAR